MSKLFIVSNRLPVTISRRNGTLKIQSSVGGLATGLDSFHQSYNSLWIGWPGYVSTRKDRDEKKIRQSLREKNCYPVFLSKYDVENYYHGFCNKTIWPLFHYFTERAVYDNHYWEAYQRVNQQFFEAVSKYASHGDKIWIHDYQLMLLPSLLRKKIPDAVIGFFLHIPFPSSEIFRLLPFREEIINGILGADLIGFHTHDYVHHFTETVRKIHGYEYSFGQIGVGDRTVKVDAFPMGIDYQRFQTAARSEKIQREIKKLRNTIGDRKIILSIDRLDYTKGIPERLQAFDLFLEKYPAYRGKVTLVCVAVPSRTSVEHYIQLKKQVDELISSINGKYGDMSWMPIMYMYRLLPFQQLVPLYTMADVALITPLRDGMNLIAKEYIASKPDASGVLILGEMAGAAQELGEAFIVNSHNQGQIARAIKQALSLPRKEQIRRNKIMQKRLQRYDIDRWAHDFMERLDHIKVVQAKSRSRRLSRELTKRLFEDYKKSTKRLLLLDYDGTLTHFTGNIDDARPNKKVRQLLTRLVNQKKNEVVIVSGRRKATLDQWFGDIALGFVAEHGVWTKNPGRPWSLIKQLKAEWKQQIRPILEVYVDRTPGSFIEEKEHSLVWHYRKADPKLALLRAGELKDALMHLVSNLSIGVMEGNKVIEIKNRDINKGRAVMKWVNKKKWDFILSIGDDVTDEDIFDALPDAAYSIKVGIGITKARYTIGNPGDVIKLIHALTRMT
jgi:trehalose 6-phosphate synthase/phosphatase